MHLISSTFNALIIIALSTLTTGCSSLFYSSNLPDDAPRGYVEFYADGPHRIGDKTWVISKAVGGKTKVVNSNNGFIDQGRKRRITESPGIHTYQVSLGNAKHSITTSVADGMVRPIKITLYPGFNKHESIRVTHYFTMSVIEEELVRVTD